MVEDTQRRLAAIVSADVVGYSLLMGVDEARTLAALRAHRTELIDPLIDQHRGRIVKVMGDGLLLEFPSVVNATQCAIEIQKGMADRNDGIDQDQRIIFRIGVNLGDIIIEGEDILGDGVNVAARLQEIAEPGGVSIARRVYEEVQDRLDALFEDTGEQTLKNIARPIQIWRWSTTGASAVTDQETVDDDSLPLPDKPSIAVLPFDNMSGDPDQEFFADGITEDIITALSRFPNLIVIARNSCFTYKGKPVKVQDVRRDLSVRYILEGSVRKAGSRVRITTQLIDAESGDHIWAERFDRELDDIFAVQDEVTSRVVATIPGRLEYVDVERTRRKPTENMAAYDYLLRGKIHHQRGTKEDNRASLEALNAALELDPNYAHAHAWKACSLSQSLIRRYTEPEGLYDQIMEEVQTAISLDPQDTDSNRLLGEVRLAQRDLDQAEIYNEKCLKMNPNDPKIVAQKGEILIWRGSTEEGAAWVEKAITVDPFGAEEYVHLLGHALHMQRRYGDAMAAYNQTVPHSHTEHAFLASCHAYLGNDEAAKTHAVELLKFVPDFSIAKYIAGLRYAEEKDRAHHREGLAKAGLPE